MARPNFPSAKADDPDLLRVLVVEPFCRRPLGITIWFADDFGYLCNTAGGDLFPDPPDAVELRGE